MTNLSVMQWNHQYIQNKPDQANQAKEQQAPTGETGTPAETARTSTLFPAVVPRSGPQPDAPKPKNRTGRWSLDEKILFLYGLRKFGKGRWKKISIYLPNRSLVQIKSHAQKVLKRAEEGENIFRRLEDNQRRMEQLVADIHAGIGGEPTVGSAAAPPRRRIKLCQELEDKVDQLMKDSPGLGPDLGPPAAGTSKTPPKKKKSEDFDAASALCALAGPGDTITNRAEC